MPETKIPVGPVASSALQTLAYLKDLTQKTGIIHELQAKHLNIWSKGMLETNEVEIRVTPEDSELEFRCVFNGVLPDNLDYRLLYLDCCCRFLLGSDYRVQVIVGSDVIWDNDKEKPWPSNTSTKTSASRSKSGKKKSSRR